MLSRRLASAVVLIAVFTLLCWLDCQHHFGLPGLWLLPVGILACVTSSVELVRLVFTAQDKPVTWTIHLGVLMVFSAAAAPIFWAGQPTNLDFRWPVVTLALAVMLVLVSEMSRYQQPGNVSVRIALAVFVICYVGVFMSFFVGLRTIGGNRQGMVALLSVIVIVKLSDITAYVFGHLVGRRKLAPTLSPGKTVEGAIGGLASACLGAWLMLHLAGPMLVPEWSPAGPLWCSIVYGLVVGLAGMIGDLTVSLIKRDARQKDSGTWLPGMGGTLDLVDSLLAAAPVAYACWILGLVG